MEHDRPAPEILSSFGVSRETGRRLEVFADLLLRWNRRINLVGSADRSVVWRRHILDSAQLAPMMLATADRAVDLGSGAGFPGMILAVITNIPFDLVEADHRKAAFLREAARLTGAPVRVRATRAEALCIPPVPLITARACAPLPALLELAAPILASEGFCLFPKGAAVDHELTDARAQWHMRVERFPSRTEPEATILRLSEILRVGERPRP